MGGRVVEPQTAELSLAGNKGARQHHLPRPPSQPKSQREQVSAREFACTAQTPNAVLLRIHTYSGGSDSFLLLQGPS